MRPAPAVLSAAALFAMSGVIGAGCGTQPIVALESLDSGLSSVESGLPSGPDATIDARSDAAGASVTLSTATVDFGLVTCGKAGTNKVYSVTNSSAGGSQSITYSASIPGGSVFSVVAGSSGLVFPGATGSITIGVSSIPTTSIAGTPLTSTLTITTDVPGATSITVPLQVTPQGGALTLSPALADFGQVQLANAGTPIPLAISNTGNAPVTVTFGAPLEPDGGSDPELALVYPGSPASVTIAPGGSLSDAGATFLPTTPGAKSVTAAVVTTDPLCGSPPVAIAMTGTGTTAQISVGPGALPFGAVSCGQTAAPRQVTLTNTSPDAVSFTGALGRGTSSPFTIDVSAGTLPGDTGDAGTVVITVTPKAIPSTASLTSGAFDDTLVVTPKTPFVPATTIALEESASGAILAALMTKTGFGAVDNETASLSFTVTNTGNVDAPLVVVASGSGYEATVTSSPATANAGGGVAIGKVTLTPVTNGSDPGTLTVTTTAPLCAAPPAVISLTATSAVPVASVSAGVTLAAPCDGGTGGGSSQGSVTITNKGNAPLAISSAASGLGAFAIVSAPTAPIATNESGVIALQAVASAQEADGGSAIADTLTFVTNEPGNPTRSVPVTVTVSCP